MKGNFAAFTLVAVGAVALGANLDLFELDLVALLKKWWPLALIAIGLALFLTPDEAGRQKN